MAHLIKQIAPQSLIYKSLGIYWVAIIILFLVVTSGCNKSSNTNAGTDVDAGSVKLKITLVDKSGLPISGVTVSSETFAIKSQSENSLSQLVVAIQTDSSSGLFRLKKTGYVDALLYLENSRSDVTREVTMLKRLPAMVIDGDTGGTFISVDGATVTVPMQALVKPDGTPATGAIKLYITPINVQDSKQTNAFPGSFYGLPDPADIPVGEDPQQLLISYGVVEYSFFQNGEELQLKDGLIADLELPIYASETIYGAPLVVGDKIPLWTLNESTGIWEQESVGRLIVNPLTESGFSLNAQTTHFTRFNVDAWSGFSSGFGAGGGGGTCNADITIVGATENQSIEFTIEIPIWNSRVSRTIYDTYVSIPIFRGLTMLATVSQGDNTATQRFGCSQSTIILVLDETPPEFTNWALTAEPVFSRISPTSNYEILENKVMLGGRFIGTPTVDIVTSLVGAETLTLPNGRFFEARFKKTDPTPSTITATLTNDFGTTEDVTQVEYVSSSAPIFEYFFIAPSLDGIGIEFNWQVEGADSATVYYLGEDPTSIGTLVFTIEDLEVGTINNSQLMGLSGFVRIDFTNQYGNTVTIGRIKDFIRGCDTDQCA